MAKKNEIDKEEMFRKIMPSSGAVEPAPGQDAPARSEGQPQSAPIEVSPSQMAPGPGGTPAGDAPQAPPAPQEAPPAAAAAPPPAQAPAQAVPGPVPEAGEEQPYPLNVAELLVEEHYPRYRNRLEGCECQRCRDDVFGIALNKIRPRYVASDRLQRADLADRELITETVTALMQAIFIVKRNPHHDEDKPLRQ